VKSKPGKPADNNRKKRVNVINKDVVVFAFFLFLSFIFWYLNSLGKEIEAGIRYPVKYINLPKEKEIVEEAPSKLNLYLKGPGYSILKLKLSGNRVPVNIDISKVNYNRIPGSKALNYFILTSTLTKSLTVQLRSGCEVTSIKPDTLFFTLERAGSKIAPVIPEDKFINIRKK
jgi:hypothetical protein